VIYVFAEPVALLKPTRLAERAVSSGNAALIAIFGIVYFSLRWD